MIKKTIKCLVFILGISTSLSVVAEGSYQAGLNQPFRDFDASNERFFVDILSAGEVINVHLCGDKDEDDVQVRIFDPSNKLILDTSLLQSNIACNHDMSTPLNNPIQYTTLTTGAYSLELENQGVSGDRFNLRRIDISVTANASAATDPSANSGRLWAMKWSFDTDSFEKTFATNADYYPLVPGGRADTNYVWKLDLNNFSGNVYEIIANDIGVEAPRSGYSTAITDNDVKTKFPIYLSYPAVANARPIDPPLINSFRFIDNAGQDNAFSPSVSTGIQDSGIFEFISDVNGTYAIMIDSNNDAVFDENDTLLLGNAVVGTNQVTWDGKDTSGQIASAGSYHARLQLRLGEYHFIGRDVETSGGPADDGLTIYLANADGSTTDTHVFWDDKTFLNGTSTLPLGALSSTPEGKHTWGDFSELSIGNISFMDTYVYGLSTTDLTTVTISTSDALQTGVDGSVSPDPERSNPGDSFTVIVNDADLNLNSSVIESTTVRVVNGRSAETETLILKETNASSGVFSGDMTTVENATAGTNNTGSINVQVNDVLTITYQDQLDSAGASNARTATHSVGVADISTTGIEAAPASIIADGSSTSTITVRLKDRNGNNLTIGGESVSLSTTAGTLSSVTDNNDGTYRATLTSSATIESATVSGTFNGNAITATAVVAFVASSASTTTSTLSAAPTAIAADGVSKSTITVQLKDVNGNNLTTGGDGVVLSTTTGTLTAVVDNNNGTYSATLTSSIIVGTATISGTLNGPGKTIADTVSVAFVAFADEDADGIADSDEGTGDSDGDGIADFMDPDSDNDGIPDIIEKHVDSDKDGVPDYKDLDSDNDGVTDIQEGTTDTDNDGIANYLDLDSDNDGLADIREAGGVDINTDARVDNFADENADGLDDTLAVTPLADTDSDNDNIPDRLELDSDNDSIKDLIEAGGVDINNDGRVDGFTDNDNDGIDDTLALTPLSINDTDKDGVPDYRDRDSDNDGVPDLREGIVDTDNDGVADYHDLDSDNDGIPDLIEAGGKDGAGNGRVDNFVDKNGDGLDDRLASIALADRDSDIDSIPDRRDLDSDNDTVNDLLEAGGVDSNSDGIVDGFTDINGDGYDDMLSASPLTPPDTDNDGIPDFQDNDDFDNDGVADIVDLDDDNDGIPDAIEASSDTDSDGVADSLELDSDNDGIKDLIEAGGFDSNNDGMVDNQVDNNADGLDDTIAATPLPDTDTDSNGMPDRRQLDSDNDGIPDATEGVLDTDSDGIPDYRDLDSDNDGIVDAKEGAQDTDADGIPDYLDLDSDSDGIDDIIEAGGGDSNADARVDNLVDANGDGLDDSISAQPLADNDTDSDGLPDRRDLDSDNDSIADLIEAGGVDSNGDRKVDGFIDTNSDGRDDVLSASPLSIPDSDSDGIPDFQDNEKGIETGLDGVGGGCSLSSQPTTDPMLPLLVVISVMVMTRRIKKRNRKEHEKY